MDVELQLNIENLLSRYVHAIDDDRLEDWPGFFVEKGRYRITTAEKAQRYRHMMSSTLVERIDARCARATSNFQVVRIMHTGESVLFAGGRYLDRIRLDGTDLRFEEKIVVLDSRSVDTLLAIPL